MFIPKDIVIIPKKLRLRAIDMTKEEASDLFHVARHIGTTLERHHGCTAINFGIQDGTEAGQSVAVISVLFCVLFAWDINICFLDKNF